VLDTVSRYASAISLAAIALLSIFNIGYFWKIGLHFLGLIDLTNLVYSFGLSLAAVFLTGSIGAFVFRRSSSLLRIIAAVAVGGALSMWGIIRFSPRTLDPELAENGAILIGFIVSCAAFFGLVRLRRQGGAKWDWRDLAALVFCLTAATFQAGGFTAALELSDRFTYSINTKSGVIENVRIMRSSSAGFLVVADGKIMFVPQGEVRGIESSPRR
jgi:predicted permease